jgi:hypothetical protein
MLLKLFFAFVFASPSLTADPSELADLYRARYNLQDPYKFLLDGRGVGDERLYGTRSVRVVLHGVLYRGGGNNGYHKTNPRNNVNPLPEDALENLCKEGFSSAIYAYSEGYAKASKEKKCDSFRQNNHRFSYHQKSPNAANLQSIMDMIHRVIISQQEDGPIYFHCWNGWHASGQLAALALIQFCDVTNEQAVKYWEKTVAGDPTKYPHVIKAIRDYKVFTAYQITAEEKAKICPKL